MSLTVEEAYRLASDYIKRFRLQHDEHEEMLQNFGVVAAKQTKPIPNKSWVWGATRNLFREYARKKKRQHANIPIYEGGEAVDIEDRRGTAISSSRPSQSP